ncbi:hypothetical protein [Paraburkholderia sp. JHI869]|uniref:hypothetical protein n=1 Tax=Paraburkholderia sp. JHI869 TaxID=3112959 RepID=UPI00316EF24C
MEADDLQAAYDAYVTAKGKFDDQSNAITRGDSGDFELLLQLLHVLNIAQHCFSALAAQVTVQSRKSQHLRCRSSSRRAMTLRTPKDVGFAFAAVRKPNSAVPLRALIEASIKQQTDGESALRASGASWRTELPGLN